MTLEPVWLLLTVSAYFVASCCYLLQPVYPKVGLENWAYGAAVIGLAANGAAIGVRTYLVERVPLANMYEFGMLLVFLMSVVYLFLEYRQERPILGAFILPVIFLLQGGVALFYREGKPLMPALKSGWLTAHVVTAVLAYGLLAIAFALALMYLWKADLETRGAQDTWAKRFPSLYKLEQLVNQCIFLALPMLTLLLVTGAVWAEAAWGAYWRWDPKESWSLITWLVYIVYLHGRVSLGWQGKKAMNWAVFGFVVVLFTFFGVNLLIPGLHSYAS